MTSFLFPLFFFHLNKNSVKQKHTHPQSTVDEATDYYFFDYLIPLLNYKN